MPDAESHHYAGFWARCGAYIIDSLLLLLITAPLLAALYMPDYFDAEVVPDYFLYLLGWGDAPGAGDDLIVWLLPPLATILFWKYRQATPGKMVIAARIVDAESGLPPSTAQCIVRYLGYFLSLFAVGLGYLWIAFDRRKQGWHDKLAGTVVIQQTITPRKVSFPTSPTAAD